jgi:outer membrane protein
VRTNKLVIAGKNPQTDLLTIQSQGATETLNVVTAENTLARAILSLQQQMNLPISQAFDIDVPQLPAATAVNLPDLGQVIAASHTTLPDFKIVEGQIRSANWQLKSAKSNYYPSISGFGSLSSRGSSTALKGYPSYIPGYPGTPGQSYFDQAKSNRSENIGLSVNVPIFNRYATRNSVAIAKLNVKRQLLQMEQTTQTVDKNVQSAYLDALTAQKKLLAVQSQVSSTQTAFEFGQKRYDVGLLNSFDFINLQNQFSYSQSDYLQAKYDFFFKLKVLDFYQGKALTFNP